MPGPFYIGGNMPLEEKRYEMDEWNNDIVPLVKEGKLKDVSEDVSMGFLVIGQIMQAVIEDETGDHFTCFGWERREGPPFVQVTKRDNNIKPTEPAQE